MPFAKVIFAYITMFGLLWAPYTVLAADPDPDKKHLTFEKDVRPIFKAYCFECHGEGAELKGSLDLRLQHFMVKGGDSGPAIAPGKIEESFLIDRIKSEEMPPGEVKLDAKQLATITSWIEQGAKTDGPEPKTLEKGLHITAEERNYWAFQPIKNSTIPAIADSKLVQTPIDAFLLQKLEANGMTFSSLADRTTLIRRAYFDLLGLPPTPEEVQEFLADKRPDAFAHLIDQLLDSPHYGERWGRHWLDVAGYADSEGYTIDDPERKYAYKYRDYVIRSFNKDKPFDQFIIEQLAGDELVPLPHKNLKEDEIEKLVATGFLRMAPDGTGINGVDQPIARNQVMADTLQIVGSSLLGLTIHCAQCHNHRYDPISQADYYRIRAIFEPAYDWKNWRKPSQRLISLYTDADKQAAAEIEAEAKQIDQEYQQRSKELIAETLEDQLQQHVPTNLHDPLREAYNTNAKKRTPEQNKLLREYPKILKISRGSLYLYDREISRQKARLTKELKQKTTAYLAKAQAAAIKSLPGNVRARFAAAVKVPAAKRTDGQKQIVAGNAVAVVTNNNLKDFDAAAAAELDALRAEIDKLVARAPQLTAISDKAAKVRAKKPKQDYIRVMNEVPGKVNDTFLFHRGDFRQPKEKLEPASLAILSLGQSNTIVPDDKARSTTGRRLAYAKYLTSGEHPLVARVLVNRFWMHHFGKGLVNTTGDFGHLGDRPTHPKLLDWLAYNFMQDGWSLKRFHRLIMNSRAYQQQLRKIPTDNDTDPDNLLLSGMSLRRLEAESVRDYILKISGKYNAKMFGPPVPVHFDRIGQVVIGKDNTDSAGRPGKPVSMNGEELRRSIYVQMRRSQPLAMLETFDAPRMSPNCEARPSSTVAPQSLLLMNNEFVIHQCEELARRVQQTSGNDLAAQIKQSWQFVYSRDPAPAEIENAKAFLARQTRHLKAHPVARQRSVKEKNKTPELMALASLCQTLVSSNEFLYVD